MVLESRSSSQMATSLSSLYSFTLSMELIGGQRTVCELGLDARWLQVEMGDSSGQQTDLAEFYFVDK